MAQCVAGISARRGSRCADRQHQQCGQLRNPPGELHEGPPVTIGAIEKHRAFGTFQRLVLGCIKTGLHFSNILETYNIAMSLKFSRISSQLFRIFTSSSLQLNLVDSYSMKQNHAEFRQILTKSCAVRVRESHRKDEKTRKSKILPQGERSKNSVP